jgi:diaminopimelate decarboxylase
MLTSECLTVNNNGHLEISGCDTVKLAEIYGTPIYVYSENQIRNNCRQYMDSFKRYYNSNGKPIYATKAFCCLEMCRIAISEGLDLDVVSGGELYTALKSGADPKRIHFHGNNKTVRELQEAIQIGVGDLIVDNMEELDRIEEISKNMGRISEISLRIKPGIDAHTHEFIRTGQIDSKFGFALENGEVYVALSKIQHYSSIKLKGIHCHIGSQVFDTAPFVEAANVMIDLAKDINDKYNVDLEFVNLGGGIGIKYIDGDKPVPFSQYMKSVSEAVKEKCNKLGMKIPKIFLEPGRSIVGDAGITLYKVGSIKEIAGVRNYIAIDGGMSDNPRYALYDAKYTCIIANRASKKADYLGTVAGKCCESGDLIQKDTMLQKPEINDILAVLTTGAYNYSMASNYNRICKPACIMVKDGNSRIVVKAETYEDLVMNDI